MDPRTHRGQPWRPRPRRRHALLFRPATGIRHIVEVQLGDVRRNYPLDAVELHVQRAGEVVTVRGETVAIPDPGTVLTGH
jgi:hypothetical protein